MSQFRFPVFLLLLCSSFFVKAQNTGTYSQKYKSDYNSSDFADGESFGVNFSIDGIGFAANSTFRSEHQLGFSIAYRPLVEFNDRSREVLNLDQSFYFNGEFNLHLGNSFIERYNAHSIWRKYKKHYISFKPGVRIGIDNNYDFALTWKREAFNVKTRHRAFVLDAGARFFFENEIRIGPVFNNIDPYVRLAWNWFGRKET